MISKAVADRATLYMSCAERQPGPADEALCDIMPAGLGRALDISLGRVHVVQHHGLPHELHLHLQLPGFCSVV